MLALLGAGAGAESVLDVQAGAGRLGPWSWDDLALRRLPRPEQSPGLELHLSGVRLGQAVPAGDVSLSCPQFDWASDGAACSGGRLVLPEQWLALDGPLDLRVQALPEAGYRLRLEHPQLLATVDWAAQSGLVIELERLDIGAIDPLLDALLAPSALGGRASGTVRVGRDGLEVALVVEEAFFDTADGRFAGDGLDLDFELSTAGTGESLDITLRQKAGELLLGAVYLPPPDQPVVIDATLGPVQPHRLSIQRMALNDPGSLSLSGSAELAAGDAGWALERLVIDALDARLSSLWPRWLDGPAAAVGFPDVVARGRIHGSLDWRVEGRARVDLTADDLTLRDPRERVGVRALDAALGGTDQAMRVELDWDAVELLGLALGGGSARLHYDEVGLRLLEPVRVALFDGALVIDGLAALHAAELESRLVLDARIEPVDLARLTRALDWPELGGQLAGRFPGVTYSDQRLAFTGGIEIDAFSGRVGVEELVIERLFSSAPALSAQVELERLDLIEATGAFGFGRMEGQASGWVRDLRLLNWRPVAMDARLYTHEDAPRRRISQRAVDNLSSLGGGGSAVISGTILRLFEDFPYRRAGLACRLGNNICHIDGVAPHESGGFLIVEGRGLPRLDIVGHRRLVDWPQLMDQLGGMIERGSAETGDGQGGAAP